MIENAVEPERKPENEKKLVEMQTFLLAYLTAKVSLRLSDVLETALSVSALLKQCVLHF